MRVAVVTESFLPQVNGVTTSVVKVVDDLTRRGHDALIIAPGPGPDQHASHEVVRTRAVGLPGYREVRLGWGSGRLERALIEFEPDVVHLASPVVLGRTATRTAASLRLPLVAVFQTHLPQYASSYHCGFACPALWRWLRRIHNQADLTLAPTRHLAAELKGRGFHGVDVWGRGVDTGLFHPDRRSEALRRLLSPEGNPIVGYVGRLSPEKEVDLLSPLARLLGCQLVVVGDGPSKSRLQRALPDAIFTGYLHGPELATAYASIDLLVHTGRNETFGQVIQEALASGTPVLGPACGGPLELIRPDENGWLWPPDHPEEIGVLAAALLNDRHRLRRLARNARSSVAHRTWPAVVDHLLDHYQRLPERSARRWVA